MKLLQTLELDGATEVDRLHYSFWPLAGSGAVRPVMPTRRGGLMVPTGTRLDMDSYFNSFYENYWFAYTSLSKVKLELVVEGEAVISVYRFTKDADVYLIDRGSVSPSDGQKHLSFEFANDDPLRAESGRVWFEIDATGDTELVSGGWYTPETPDREVNLGVVICTYDREDYLRRTLTELADNPDVVDDIHTLFVVNNGPEFDLGSLFGDDPADLRARTSVVEQDNIGGCGGFTRGIHECLEDGEITHFVLMDDDIFPHARSVSKLRSMMAFANEKVVLGGHMLNLRRPAHLSEAGATIDRRNLIPSAIGQDAYLGNREGLALFLDIDEAAYCGWWLFCAPVSSVTEQGLPMPCFIRGDDIEFGLRLSLNGFQAVPVPGVAVWHEPFYLKLGDWQFYFELRNRMTTAALLGIGDWDAILGDFEFVFFRDLKLARYYSCALMAAAVLDFTQGPDACFDTSSEALQRCFALRNQYAPEELDGTINSALEQGSIDTPIVWDHEIEHAVGEHDRQYLVRSSKGLPTLRYERNDVTAASLVSRFEVSMAVLRDPGQRAILIEKLQARAITEAGWGEFWSQTFAGQDAS